MQQSSYYPFGLEMPGMGDGLTREEQPYLYNGKESLNDLDLGWYDYGARFYDPGIGRFMSVDPKAEQFPWQSLYAYAASNPIKFIDKNGENPAIPLAAALSTLLTEGAIGASGATAMTSPPPDIITPIVEGVDYNIREFTVKAILEIEFAKNKIRSTTKTNAYKAGAKTKPTNEQKKKNDKNPFGPKKVVGAGVALKLLELYINGVETKDVGHDEMRIDNYVEDDKNASQENVVVDDEKDNLTEDEKKRKEAERKGNPNYSSGGSY